MNQIPVSSSSISSIGYDPSTQKLEVQFHGGSVYQYDNVPEAVYSGFINASSHGQYLHQYIKGKYPYRKIG